MDKGPQNSLGEKTTPASTPGFGGRRKWKAGAAFPLSNDRPKPKGCLANELLFYSLSGNKSRGNALWIDDVDIFIKLKNTQYFLKLNYILAID
jgi:hypothetical protein